MNMAQVFHRSFNTLCPGSAFSAMVLSARRPRLGGGGPHPLRLRDRRQGGGRQPIPFGHQHHVSGLGIDCRYSLRHDRREGPVRRHAADADVHELPSADLDREPDARSGPDESQDRQVPLLAAGSPPRRLLCLLRSQHPRQEGGRLFDTAFMVRCIRCRWFTSMRPCTWSGCLEYHRGTPRSTSDPARRSSTMTGCSLRRHERRQEARDGKYGGSNLGRIARPVIGDGRVGRSSQMTASNRMVGAGPRLRRRLRRGTTSVASCAPEPACRCGPSRLS